MNKYRIKYSLDSAPGAVFVKDIAATGPVRALDIFHKDIQEERGIGHKSYSVDFMGLVYGASAFQNTGGDVIESSFDLPKCGNPDLTKVKEKPIEQEPWF